MGHQAGKNQPPQSAGFVLAELQLSFFGHSLRTTQFRRRTTMNIRKKFLDYEYEEVLDGRVRELIRVGCAIAVGCPT